MVSLEACTHLRLHQSVHGQLFFQQSSKMAFPAGIWTKDLKYRTNLQQLQITKILKTLEQRSLVKAVKSASNASRKVYMLFELEPAKELTGGAWCVLGFIASLGAMMVCMVKA